MNRRCIALGALTLSWLAVASFPARARAAEPARTAVMVLYFDNDTGNKEYDNLAKGLADMMITDLASVPSLRVVEREKLDALLAELKLQRKKYFDPKTAQRIGKGTGAAYAVTGSFISIEPNIRLDVRMMKIENATIVKSASVTGTKDKFFDLQQQLTAKLVEGLSGLLSAGDSGRVVSASRANKIDSLSVLLDYSKGLDASDRGDLDAASKQMQKVVSVSPDFQLGKDRYRQIMQALYQAKDRRTTLLSASERTLLDHAQAEIVKGTAASSKRNLAYRILLGQYHLIKVAQAIAQGRPAAEYQGHLRAHVDNQVKLFEETQAVPMYALGNDVGTSSEEDRKIAEELGIKMPGNAFAFHYHPFEVLRELGRLLMNNSPSIMLVTMDGSGVACLYQLDPYYAKLVPQIYQQTLDNIERYGGPLKERDTMWTLQEFGHALATLGRPEEAIAKLQGGLERYPKSEEFGGVEKEIREILAGEYRARCKKM